MPGAGNRSGSLGDVTVLSRQRVLGMRRGCARPECCVGDRVEQSAVASGAEFSWTTRTVFFIVVANAALACGYSSAGR